MEMRDKTNPYYKYIVRLRRNKETTRIERKERERENKLTTRVLGI